jgi:hypothetical protein
MRKPELASRNTMGKAGGARSQAIKPPHRSKQAYLKASEADLQRMIAEDEAYAASIRRSSTVARAESVVDLTGIGEADEDVEEVCEVIGPGSEARGESNS